MKGGINTMEFRKELDRKLHEIEDRENLENDTKNTKRFGDRAMEYIKRDYIKNIETLRQAYIQENMDMSVYEMDIANSVFEFIENA
jgi:hypothetical protein